MMKLQFKNQKFQSDAAKVVTDVFEGQRNSSLLEYTIDKGYGQQGTLDIDTVGFRNVSDLQSVTILQVGG